MNKKAYLEASIEIIEFLTEDVITTSDPWGGGGNSVPTDPWGGGGNSVPTDPSEDYPYVIQW